MFVKRGKTRKRGEEWLAFEIERLELD